MLLNAVIERVTARHSSAKTKNKINKHALQKLTTYVCLILCGLRDAYLIDCWAFLDVNEVLRTTDSIVTAFWEEAAADNSSDPNANQVLSRKDNETSNILPTSTLTSQMNSSHQMGTSNQQRQQINITIVVVGDNYFLIRQNALLYKMENLLRNDWSEHPFLVDLNGKQPQVIEDDDETVNNLTLDLISALPCLTKPSQSQSLDKASKVDIGIDIDIELPRVINFDADKIVATSAGGLPFVAGWLLGYPCIYLSCRPENSLSMEPLFKHSLVWDPLSDVDVCGVTSPIDLMEFTVPRRAVEDYPHLDSRLRDILKERRDRLQGILVSNKRWMDAKGSIELLCTEALLSQAVL